MIDWWCEGFLFFGGVFFVRCDVMWCGVIFESSVSAYVCRHVNIIMWLDSIILLDLWLLLCSVCMWWNDVFFSSEREARWTASGSGFPQQELWALLRGPCPTHCMCNAGHYFDDLCMLSFLRPASSKQLALLMMVREWPHHELHYCCLILGLYFMSFLYVLGTWHSLLENSSCVVHYLRMFRMFL